MEWTNIYIYILYAQLSPHSPASPQYSPITRLTIPLPSKPIMSSIGPITPNAVQNLEGRLAIVTYTTIAPHIFLSNL